MSKEKDDKNDIVEKARVFALRFLDAISKRGIEEIAEEDLIECMKYVSEDGRYSSLIGSIFTLPTIFLKEDVIDKIPAPPFFKSRNENGKRLLKLDSKSLSDFTKVATPINKKSQLNLDKIADDWIASKEDDLEQDQRYGDFLKVYNRLPNGGNYKISRSKELGWWAKFKRDYLAVPTPESVHWSLVTDGIANYATGIPSSEEQMLVPGTHDLVPAGHSRNVRVNGANFVALHGYVGEKLVAVRLFTVARDDELKNIKFKTINQYEGPYNIDEPPRIKILKRD